MRVKRILIAVLALFIIIGPNVTYSTTITTLPEDQPDPPTIELGGKAVTFPVIKIPARVNIYWGYPGPNSRFEIGLKNLENAEPSDVKDGTYLGWCAERNVQSVKNMEIEVKLFPSYDREAMPSSYRWVAWERINFILNHKFGATPEEVQEAIWSLTNPEMDKKKLSDKTASLLAEANEEKNAHFIPAEGDVAAIIADTGYDNQLIFFELAVPANMVATVLPPVAPAAPATVAGWFPIIPIIPIIPGGGGGNMPPIYPPPTPPPAPVPEPSTFLLFGSGLAGLLFYKTRHK